MELIVRSIDRFEYYEKAIQQLKRCIDKGDLNEFEKLGLIQCFENTFELAWRVMKDYLSLQGIQSIIGSRDAITASFENGLIADEENWINMVDDRILMIQSYINGTEEVIRHKIYTIYFNLLHVFYIKLKSLESYFS
jgi:nucleotidyltransferase substrate binding protein (TIGR01987 family)